MEKRSMTCIVCPVGCRLTATIDNGKVIAVEGNKCRRGEKYAIEEITNPTRTLTTTVRVDGGEYPLVPVKTSAPIPKPDLLKAMEIVKTLRVNAPVKLGDVIVKDFIAPGVDLVACRNISNKTDV
jgi:CxxC motif-containing protein